MNVPESVMTVVKLVMRMSFLGSSLVVEVVNVVFMPQHFHVLRYLIQGLMCLQCGHFIHSIVLLGT